MRNGNYYAKRRFRERDPRNRIFFGVMIALIGVAYLLKAFGLFAYFNLEDSWPLLLIAAGILLGIKHRGRRNAWWIMIVVGIAYMVPQFNIGKVRSHDIAWPAGLVLLGIVTALRPHKKRGDCYPGMGNTIINTNGDLNVDVTFGGRKEVVTSKEFRGGTVSVTFGGAELNLAQADFSTPTAVLDFHVSFGGVEMVVPSHWEVQNEVSPSFGSVEDQRTIQTNNNGETKKILILRGNCSFGSIEIKSY